MPRLVPHALALVLASAAAGPARSEDCVCPPDERVCAPDATGAQLAVELGFAELLRLHRARVPGPNGQALLDQRISHLLDRSVGFERFIDEALGEAWDLAPERRNDWRQVLSDTLRQRYLEKLGSPLGVRLEIRGAVLDCDEALVDFELHSSRKKKGQEVTIRLYFEVPKPPEPEPADPDAPLPEPLEPTPSPTDPPRPPPTPVWRAFDVTVDGVSLLETWRGRFRKIYVDGGIAAIDQHMRTLRDRYPKKL